MNIYTHQLLDVFCKVLPLEASTIEETIARLEGKPADEHYSEKVLVNAYDIAELIEHITRLPSIRNYKNGLYAYRSYDYSSREKCLTGGGAFYLLCTVSPHTDYATETVIAKNTANALGSRIDTCLIIDGEFVDY